MVGQLWFWLTHAHKYGAPELLQHTELYSEFSSTKPIGHKRAYKLQCTECGRLRFYKVNL